MSQTWWKPGLDGGLLSRRWAQVFVFPLPRLKPAELEASLRYKVQALLPSPDLPLITRLFSHRGKPWGLVIVDRIPVDRPQAQKLTIGLPLSLPVEWPEACVLAVASPEGWELQAYRDRLLFVAYPPVATGSDVVQKILDQHPNRPVYWTSPDPDLTIDPPAWATAAPVQKPSSPWGIPLVPPPPQRWQWIVGGFLLAVGLVFLTLAAVGYLQSKVERNHRWQSWLETARPMAGTPGLSAQDRAASRALSGVPVETVLKALGAAWTKDVEIRRFEMTGGKVSLTARAPSALAAVATLAKQPVGAQFRVTQIRRVAGGEEFDLEGQVTP